MGSQSVLNQCQKPFRGKAEIWLSFICFHQPRVSKHRRPGSQGQLWAAGSNSSSQVDQRKHPGLQRRPEESDHFWLWRRSIMRQPAHALALLRRYVCSLTGMQPHARGAFPSFCHSCYIISVCENLLLCFNAAWVWHQEHVYTELWAISLVSCKAHANDII